MKLWKRDQRLWVTNFQLEMTEESSSKLCKGVTEAWLRDGIIFCFESSDLA